MFEVEFYKLENGSVPVTDFIDSLDWKMQAKALARGMGKKLKISFE